MQKDKIIYWLSTGLVSGFSIALSIIYVIQFDTVAIEFAELGYPEYLIYPLALAKFVGALVLVFTKYNSVKDLAYGGFFFNFLIALGSHIAKSDGEYIVPIIAIVLLGISYIYEERLFGNNKNTIRKS
jgi:hypothetical protein